MIPGDGLGEVGAADYIRLNYSWPRLDCFEAFRAGLPKAIAEAQEGRYAVPVREFFVKAGTARGRAIAERISLRLTK